MKKGSHENKTVRNKRRDYFDGHLLVIRLLEGFLEAAPQLLLQLYIMTVMSSTLTGNYFLNSYQSPLTNNHEEVSYTHMFDSKVYMSCFEPEIMLIVLFPIRPIKPYNK